MNNYIEDENHDWNPENLTYKIGLSEESVKEKWLKKLESNFSKQLQRFKDGPAIKYGWVLPNNALELFESYFSGYEKTIRENNKDNPAETFSMIDEETGEKYLIERDRADSELYPIVYEIKGGGILYLPLPEIPDDFIFEKIKRDNEFLGLAPSQEQLAEKNILDTIPFKKEEKGETASVKYLLLDHFFTPNKDFYNLRIKDQEQVLRFILGVRADTAKSIKHKCEDAKKKIPSKEIANYSIERFFDLLEKIKGGHLI